MKLRTLILPLLLISLAACGGTTDSVGDNGGNSNNNDNTSTENVNKDWTATQKTQMTNAIGMELPFIDLGTAGEVTIETNFVGLESTQANSGMVSQYQTLLTTAGFTFEKTGLDSYGDSMTRMSKNDVVIEFQFYSFEGISYFFAGAYKTTTAWPTDLISPAPAYSGSTRVFVSNGMAYEDGTPFDMIFAFDANASTYLNVVGADAFDYDADYDVYYGNYEGTYLQFYDNGDFGLTIEVSEAII